ncbi:helix-turn-helix transcriptional regulator [Anaeromyxobacter paludicola]|uniref:WYL domain-containing protein n=1 Tax=Anaeromyxobacter paludicola TaxID=2918171 RepID=A0ABM7XB42_9BACT|nr:WYL domain-containing protein [Anaeromyxobacter paludicola]BDG09075.1 hypothetical protein AMPC_21880 [Anaeromyxobacter paludicola]
MKAEAARKDDPRERLRRVLFLVPYAVRHPGITVRELAERCGTSEAQLLEDLDFLLTVGCPPFAPDDFLDLYVERDRVYVALHQSFTRPPRFTESEAAALAAAVKALAGEGKERVLEALRQAVPRERRKGYDELAKRIYAGSPPARESVMGRLTRAIAERRAVRIVHVTAGRTEEKERVVRPYTLARRFGHWYLFGHDRDRGRELPFRLDRIKDCAVLEETFEPPPPAALARARLFSEARGEPIRLRLSRVAAAWALARPARLRVVESGPKGEVVVEVEGADAEWATRFVLSFGGEAEVLSPPEARRHFDEAVDRALARYLGG